MTRAVFLTHSGVDSGAEQSTVALLAHWPDPEPPLLVLGGHGPVEARAARAGVEVMTVPVGASVAGARRQGRQVLALVTAVSSLLRHSSTVREVLAGAGADVVVATSLKSLVFGWLAGRRARTTVVWSLHDRVTRDYFSWYLVPVLRYVVPRLVDGVVANSRSTARTIRPGRTPVAVVPPAVELDLREFRPPRETVQRVVMLGRLSPWKGQHVFLRAFAEAFESTTAQAYVVGGALFGEDEYAAELVREAERLGIAERVHFVGHADDPYTWLEDADVLVHCSLIPEPFGMVVVQGLWARCAVVASRPGGPEEVIDAGVDGLLVASGDERGLAGALRTLRDDPALRQLLATRGREKALRFGAADGARRVHAFIEGLRPSSRRTTQVSPRSKGTPR